MSDRKIRLVGLALLVGGLILAYIFAYLPYEAAKNDESEVSLSLKVTFLIPVAIIVGAFAVIFGQKGRNWIQTEEDGKQKLKVTGWILAAVCIAAGIAFHEWLESMIAAYGYKF